MKNDLLKTKYTPSIGYCKKCKKYKNVNEMFEDKRCIKCKRDSTSTARDKTKRKVKKKDKALYFNRDRDIRPGVDGSYIYVMSFEKGL